MQCASMAHFHSPRVGSKITIIYVAKNQASPGKKKITANTVYSDNSDVVQNVKDDHVSTYIKSSRL